MSNPGYDPTAYRSTPSALTPQQERSLATLAHVIPLAAMILSAGFLGFVGSLVMWVLYKDRGPFVRQNAANALNIQITEFVLILVSMPLLLVLVGFVTWPLAIVAAAVLHVLAAARANRGEWYTPPFTPRFVK